MVLTTMVGCQQGQIAISKEHINLELNTIDMENAFNTIEELSSTKYMGRLAGTEGNEKAVEFIAQYFKEIGLEHATGITNYKQPYTQKVILNESTPILRTLDQSGNILKELEFLVDFNMYQIEKAMIDGSVTSNMISINSTSQLKSDNRELDGKVLLIDNSLLFILGGVNGLLEKVNELDPQIAGIIINFDQRRHGLYAVNPVLWGFSNNPVEAFNNIDGPIVAFVTNEIFSDLKDASNDDQRVHMEINYSFKDAEVSNVIGVIPGSDENFKNEYIIITGHMDAVGDNKNGTYQPGALDNASGTAALMEIARVLIEGDVAPKKTIVFIAFNGEENGLYGSEHYVNNPVYPLENSVVINLDMVGSKRVVPLTIGGTTDKLKNELYELARDMGMVVIKEGAVGSDQMYFNARGIEAVTLIHADVEKIHTQLDDMSNMDKDRMEEVIRLVLRYIEMEGY